MITKDELKQGDILLCKIPELSILQYLSAITKVIRLYVSTRKFDLDAATSLIHWIIGYFDQYHYFHASFWNGEMVVESRIKGGLRANDISSYVNDTVDVYRFYKNNSELGSPELPVDPLLQKAQALVDEHLPYGFDGAYLLAILCVTRWHRSQWVDRIREILLHNAHSPAVRDMMEKLFEQFRPQIDQVIEGLIVRALDVVKKYRDRKGYVCSQTVAIIYNEAAEAKRASGTYTIKKPSYALKAEPVLLTAPLTDTGESECLEMIKMLGSELAKLPPEATVMTFSAQSDYEVIQESLRADNFYTPRDLAESLNTKLAGRLKL
ncbi:MAG: hypothetical protein AMJ53_18705 [Gammaproteobacteria bacterium SG8_11]|nr:MAG: hypothetical protein AMJ53_18705 [Gammaproteobacteria bacterium SG8_11]